MGRFRGNAAWTVGTETAADTLKPEAAFDGLALYPVVGCLHWKSCYVSFQWFICAFAGCAAVTIVHDKYLLLEVLDETMGLG